VILKPEADVSIEPGFRIAKLRRHDTCAAQYRRGPQPTFGEKPRDMDEGKRSVRKKMRKSRHVGMPGREHGQ
jgi:hypothetical protein